MNHATQHYYEAVSAKGNDNTWKFRVYHYDATGNRQIIVHESDWAYDSQGEAEDAAVEWMDEHGIDAEMG